MIKYIDHHWAEGGVLQFNTTSGSVQSTSKYEWLKSPHWGTAWQQKGRWFVLHNDNTSFILQTESQVWKLTPEHKLLLRDFFVFRQFRITRGSKLIFSIWYIPRYFYLQIADPTYDTDDAESDDFFLYLINLWDSWKNREYSEFLKTQKDHKEI